MGRKPAEGVSFEEKLKQLEDIVAEIEDPACPLEHVIDLCTKGMALYAELSEKLARLERKVYEIKNTRALAEGKDTSPEMELFPHADSEEKGEDHGVER
ncbi:MAG: exodeoxyribonuclease VII small subunit [Brevinematales bacterium]|nr:exodeoxyribonuclease VII small subunit [Brevinematales bacterium]